MTQEKIFHCSFWLLWTRLSFNTAVSITVCTTIGQVFNGYRIFNLEHLLLTGIIIAGTALLAIPFVLSHIYYFPIIVNQQGISGFTYAYPNKKTFLPWSEITFLENRNRMGIPCYRLYSEKLNSAILMPRALKDHKELEALFHKYGLKDKKETMITPQIQPAKITKVINTEPVREGGYIVVSTEQDRWQKKL